MVVEYSSAQHGGLEPAPTDQYPITTTPGDLAQAVAPQNNAPELVVSSNKPEDAPEAFMPVTAQSLIANEDNGLQLPETQDEKKAEATVTETLQNRKYILVSKKMLLVGIILLLVAIIIALGVGLGVTLGRKHTESVTSTTMIPSSTAPTQIASTPSASPTLAPGSTGSVISPYLPSSTNVTTSTGQDVFLNDQLTTTHVSSWFYTGQTESQVNQLWAQNNARITQIRVDNGTVPTFTVLMIENTGVYKSSWWWYFGPNSYNQDSADRRIISVDQYYDASETLQFAVVQVPNNGAQDRAWWWYFGQTTSSITSLQTQYNARLVSLRGYEYNGDVVYVIIMAENVDEDFIQSEWHTAITIDTINSKISSGLRLISLSPNPSENWDAIFVSETGNRWGWFYGLNYSSIGATTGNNLRMVDVSPYILDGQKVFATVETDNSQ